MPPQVGLGVRFREQIDFGARGLGASFSPIETFRADQIAVAVLAGPYGIGLYAVATSFSLLSRLVGLSIGTVAVPNIAKAQSLGARAEAGRVYTLMAIAVVTLITGALEVATPWVTGTFCGQEFLDAVPMARALILGGAFMAVRRVAADCARSMGRPEIDSLSEMAGWPILLAAAALLSARSTPIALSIALAVAVSTGVAAAVGVSRLWAVTRRASNPEPTAPSEGIASW
jgi:O-antigen/teichoic acid export membrane protein